MPPPTVHQIHALCSTVVYYSCTPVDETLSSPTTTNTLGLVDSIPKGMSIQPPGDGHHLPGREKTIMDGDHNLLC